MSESDSTPRPGARGWRMIAVPAAEQVRPSTLRSWYAAPQTPPDRWLGGVLVLPEVFGVNSWVRGVADRLAGAGYAALAVPLFSRTAPALDLGYGEADLQEGRAHKVRTRAAEILADVGAGADWLQAALPPSAPAALGCVGFCFGGHAAMLAATLPAIAATAAFYGAGVVDGRPGGGPPTLDVLASVCGRLWCFCGEEDPLIPAADRTAIGAALRAQDPSGERLRLITVPGAGHGYMCRERSDHREARAEEGWKALESLLAGTLSPSG